MIALTIMFPQMVMHYKGPTINPDDVKIEIPAMPGLGGGGLGLPPFGAPAPNGTPLTDPAVPGSDLSKPPSFN